MDNNVIDFVVPWVDGSDPKWVKEFSKFRRKKPGEDSRENRYRDWDILKYWFRTVGLYAPWVRKIHFITWGHIPNWLDTTHPKINIVRHEDYIPTKNLPVFSANPIEINIHRISGLAEQFIFFNDDIFLAKPVKPADFFKHGLPRDMAVFNASTGGDIASIVMNDIRLINENFDKYTVLKKHLFKWYNYRYGAKLIRNFLLLPWSQFTGFYEPHQPYPYLKSTFIDVWKEFEEKLDQTSASKFRALSDYNQFLFRYWQFVTGKIEPYSRRSKLFFLTEDELPIIKKAFSSKKFHTLCLNDMSQTSKDFDYMKKEVGEIMGKIFPHKSEFERV